MSEYLDRYVDEDGNIEKKLTLTSDGFALLTEDIEALVDKYTGIENIQNKITKIETYLERFDH